jgi:predicted dehydrogenase
MFAIIGSGFGLYGYLPALAAECGQGVVLPERYRKRLLGRRELSRFESAVCWEADEDAALRRADGAAIVLPPGLQTPWVTRCLSMANLERFLLEKPLAESPEAARSVFDVLMHSRRAFRLGYTFRYTPWGENLRRTLRSANVGGGLTIQWRFLAHHYRHRVATWKRFNAEGGGAVRYYGIHLIALLAEIGYQDVATSRAVGPSANEYQEWRAVFTGAGLPACEVVVDTHSAVTGFSVDRVRQPGSGDFVVCSNGTTPLGHSAHPFDAGELDGRVPLVRRLCQSLMEESARPYEWYDSTLILWSRAEAATEFEEEAEGNRAR